VTGLPWVRLDTGIASHDKVLTLLQHRNGRGTAFVYVCSLAYSGLNGTDGRVPFAALPFIHGTKRDAEALVDVRLWRPARDGWEIVNYAQRQQTAAVSSSIKAGQRLGALKANCVRWHGGECGCWKAAASA
jgi:hypothetical protein